MYFLLGFWGTAFFGSRVTHTSPELSYNGFGGLPSVWPLKRLGFSVQKSPKSRFLSFFVRKSYLKFGFAKSYEVGLFNPHSSDVKGRFQKVPTEYYPSWGFRCELFFELVQFSGKIHFLHEF